MAMEQKTSLFIGLKRSPKQPLSLNPYNWWQANACQWFGLRSNQNF